MIAETGTVPYYAVIFTSTLAEDTEGYEFMAQKMVEMASIQEGFLGIESAREQVGITVSYWRDLDSIKSWKMNVDHLFAQQMGKEKWYKSYKTRICKVERDYEFKK